MIAHIINADGIVIDTILVDSLDVIPGLIDGTEGSIGDHWDGLTFTKPIPTVEELEAERIAVIKNKIATIEESNPITARNLRELGLAVGQLIHAVTGQDPAGLAYQRAKDLDAVIAALRSQI